MSLNVAILGVLAILELAGPSWLGRAGWHELTGMSWGDLAGRTRLVCWHEPGEALGCWGIAGCQTALELSREALGGGGLGDSVGAEDMVWAGVRGSRASVRPSLPPFPERSCDWSKRAIVFVENRKHKLDLVPSMRSPSPLNVSQCLSTS